MTELTVPSLPAKSDARQLSTLSTPLLFSHRLCDQEKCQEALTEQRPSAAAGVKTSKVSFGVC